MGGFDDLERLRNMSLGDDRVPPPPDQVREASRDRIRTAMILGGGGLTIFCGLLLVYVYGLASMIDPREPGYWSQVAEKMFGLKYGGWATVRALTGMLMGGAMVVFGMRKPRG